MGVFSMENLTFFRTFNEQQGGKTIHWDLSPEKPVCNKKDSSLTNF